MWVSGWLEFVEDIEEQKLIKVCSFRFFVRSEFSRWFVFWEITFPIRVAHGKLFFSIFIAAFWQFISEKIFFVAHSSTRWFRFICSQNMFGEPLRMSWLMRKAHGLMSVLKSNLTLKRRNDLLMLVLARYMSTHRIVARERSRTEWTWYSNSLMALTNVGP